MKRLFTGAVLASISVLAVAGCSASQEEVYWDAFDTGAQMAADYEPPPEDPRCSDGSITDTAEYIGACAGWKESVPQSSVREQCGEQMPENVADRATWMEGCSDGANDSPNYEDYGSHP
ncbi:hypothetical protein ACFWH4_04800 [Streptomyces sp. NPDC127091]|uniref:hypothetical protein n=1 Tax=Streptomyces sp. NPDC127091 TaxID=3347134 RepID=UPI0036481D13